MSGTVEKITTWPMLMTQDTAGPHFLPSPLLSDCWCVKHQPSLNTP